MTLEQLQALILGSIEQYQAAIHAANESQDKNIALAAAAARQLSAEDMDKYGMWMVTTVIPLLNASKTQCRTVR